LERLLDLSSRLSYEESSHLAKHFGLAISSSGLETITSSYAKQVQQQVKSLLEKQDSQVNKKRQNSQKQKQGRVMVFQLDGVYVLGQAKEGYCPGLEIKTAVLYPQDSPSERWMLADKCSAEDLLALVSGLVQEAKLRPEDTLIGLGDGANWIDNIFSHLSSLRITDVFHATEYLDVIMQALNWDDDMRAYHRKSWCKGQINARDWLQEHLPEPDTWLHWDKASLDALRYIETRLDSMDYKDFKAKGFPIGSGQIEAMNKSVIGKRMKQSGMHWSQQGAAAMAALRAQTCAKHPLVQFDDTRFSAFPLT
jgi:hypothetical protein